MALNVGGLIPADLEVNILWKLHNQREAMVNAKLAKPVVPSEIPLWEAVGECARY